MQNILDNLKSGKSINFTAKVTDRPIHEVLQVYQTHADLVELRKANREAKAHRKPTLPKDLPYVKEVLEGNMTQTEAAQKYGVKQSWISLQVSRATANDNQPVEKIHKAIKRLAALRKAPYEEIMGQVLAVRAEESRSKKRGKATNLDAEM